MTTARFALCAFVLKVCFVLITSKGHHFIPEPLICLCQQWDVKRHFWHSSPSVLPHKSLLNKFSSDSICSQPVYLPDRPPSRGNPALIWAKRQKNMCALRERDREGKVVSDLVTSTQKWGRQAAEIYISWRLTNGLPPLLFHYYHSALLCGPEACQTPQEPRWAFTVKMQTAACIIPVLS